MADENKTVEGGIAVQGGSAIFFFTYLTDESVSMQADITDNFVETNYSVQDHIAIRPRTIRLKGLVGEVVFKKSKAEDLSTFAEDQILRARRQNSSYLDTIENVITNNPVLNSLLPSVGNYTAAALKIYKQLESSYNRYMGIYKNFKNGFKPKDDLLIILPYSPDEDYQNQKSVLEDLTTLFNSRTPVAVTDFAYWSEGNSIDKGLWHIQSVNIRQTDSKAISDLEIILKEIRIAKTKYTKVDTKKNADGDNKTDPSEGGNGSKETVPEKDVKDGLNQLKKDAEKAIDDAASGNVPFQPITNRVQGQILKFTNFITMPARMLINRK